MRINKITNIIGKLKQKKKLAIISMVVIFLLLVIGNAVYYEKNGFVTGRVSDEGKSNQIVDNDMASSSKTANPIDLGLAKKMAEGNFEGNPDLDENFELELKGRSFWDTILFKNRKKNKDMIFENPDANFTITFDLLDYNEFAKEEKEEIISAEDFGLGFTKENKRYKWGYTVRLTNLNFLAKIDVKSEQEIKIIDDKTLKIGNTFVGFADLIEQNFTLSLNNPALFEELEQLGIDLAKQAEEELLKVIEEETEKLKKDKNIKKGKCYFDVTISCGTDIGICQSGIQTCSENVWGECFGQILPVDESDKNDNCKDGLDNDCDGLIDCEDSDCKCIEGSDDYIDDKDDKDDKPYCGDGKCDKNNGETCSNCRDDCGKCSGGGGGGSGGGSGDYVTGSTIRSITGFFTKLGNTITGFIVNGFKGIASITGFAVDEGLENIISIYIQKDFSETDVSVGDVINLDPYTAYGGGSAADGNIVYRCGDITASGSYVMNQSIVTDDIICLDIAVEGVVLDMQGYTITNNANETGIAGTNDYEVQEYIASTIGINQSAINFSISNGYIGEFGTALLLNDYANITDMTIQNNTFAINAIEPAENVFMRDNNFSNNIINFDITDFEISSLDLDLSNTINSEFKIYVNSSASNQVYDSTTTPDAGVIYCDDCDNLTIKDLTLGHGALQGVHISNSENINIENVNIDSATAHGIRLDEVDDANIDNIFSQGHIYLVPVMAIDSSNISLNDMAFEGTRYGVQFRNSSYSSMNNITCINTNYCIFLYNDSDYNSINDVTAINMSWAGIQFFHDVDYNNLSDINIDNGDGIRLYDKCDNNLIEDVFINVSGWRGLILLDSDNNTFRNIVANNNRYGLEMGAGSDNNYFVNFSADVSERSGIQIGNAHTEQTPDNQDAISMNNTFENITITNSFNFTTGPGISYSPTGAIRVREGINNTFRNAYAQSAMLGALVIGETQFYDSIIRGAIPSNEGGTCRTYYCADVWAGGESSFVNTTFYNSRIYESTPPWPYTSGVFYKKWYYKAHTIDTSGTGVGNAGVDIYNGVDESPYIELTTNASGWTNQTEIIEYVYNNGIKTIYDTSVIAANWNLTLWDDHVYNVTAQQNNLNDTFILDVDVTPPVLGSYQISMSTGTADNSYVVVINWSSDDPSNSSVEWGESPLLGSGPEGDNIMKVNNHGVIISELKNNTGYNFNYTSCDFAGNCNTSSGSFATLDPAEEDIPTSGGVSCVPNWKCSVCVSDSMVVGSDGSQTCTDINDCGADSKTQSCTVAEPYFPYCGDGECSSNEDCNGCSEDCGVCDDGGDGGNLGSDRSSPSTGKISRWECEEWTNCKAIYDLEDIVLGKTMLSGEKQRLCKDLNNYEFDKIEREECSLKIPIYAERVEKCFDDFLEVFNEDNVLISRLRLVDGQYKELDVQMIFDEAGYCPYCFDGQKNFDEDEIDCVYEIQGSCPLCSPEVPFIRQNYSYMLLILLVLTILCFLFIIWFLILLKRDKKRKKKIVRISKRYGSYSSHKSHRYYKNVKFNKKLIALFLLFLAFVLLGFVLIGIYFISSFVFNNLILSGVNYGVEYVNEVNENSLFSLGYFLDILIPIGLLIGISIVLFLIVKLYKKRSVSRKKVKSKSKMFNSIFTKYHKVRNKHNKKQRRLGRKISEKKIKMGFDNRLRTTRHLKILKARLYALENVYGETNETRNLKKMIENDVEILKKGGER